MTAGAYPTARETNVSSRRSPEDKTPLQDTAEGIAVQGLGSSGLLIHDPFTSAIKVHQEKKRINSLLFNRKLKCTRYKCQH